LVIFVAVVVVAVIVMVCGRQFCGCHCGGHWPSLSNPIISCVCCRAGSSPQIQSPTSGTWFEAYVQIQPTCFWYVPEILTASACLVTCPHQSAPKVS